MMTAPLMMNPRNMEWGIMSILMGLEKIRMLPARIMRPIWMR